MTPSNVRLALRQLVRRPAFAVTALLSIALGIGVNTTVFSVANGLLFRAPPVARPGEMVRVYLNHHSPFRYEDYRAIKERNTTFASVIAEVTRVVGFAADGGEVERATVGIVSGDYFAATGIRPALGRFFTRDRDDVPSAVPEVVLSHAFWTKRFAADPGIIGRTVRLNDRAFTVAGVAPKGFTTAQVLWAPDAWLPMSESLTLLGRGPEVLSGSLYLSARLAPGVTRGEADADVRRLFAQVAADDPERLARQTWRVDGARGVNAELRDPIGMASALLLAISTLVLVVACANVGNLLLARNMERRREVGVRLALGARRGRVTRFLLTEAVLIGAGGAVLALLATRWSAGLIAGLVPADAGIALSTTPDALVLAFTLALVLATILIAGLAPALQATRGDLTIALRDGAPGTGTRRSRLRRGFLMVQVAVSTVLLACAGLFVRSLARAQGFDPGFPTTGIVDVRLDLGEQSDAAGSSALLERLEERFTRVAGVSAVSAASMVPLTFENSETVIFREGDPVSESARGRQTFLSRVSPGYFAMMGIPLVQGREFRREDRAAAPAVAIVNEAFAERLWPGEPALGKRFSYEGPTGPWVEIVGVARNIRYNTLGEEPPIYLYAPFAQFPARNVTVHLRLHDGVSIAPVRRAVVREARAADPSLPPPTVRTLDEEQQVTLLPARLGAALTGAFGGLALLLASVGIFGVAAAAVAGRTRELGIRSALGAPAALLVRAVLGETVRTVATGAVVGLVLALGVSRLLSSQLYGVGTADPVTFSLASLVLLGAALLATIVPARRATRVDPVEALRAE